MASKHREENIIQSTQCPQCNAWRGSACFVDGKPARSRHGGPFVHPARRQLWIEAKQQQAPKTLETV